MDDRAIAGGDRPTAKARFRPTNIKLVIFDCDGVLIDSEPIASATLAEALGAFGVEMTAAQAHARFTGFSDRETRQFCRDQLGVEDLDALYSLWTRNLFRGFERLEEMRGIADVVTALDCPVCVASNSTLHRLTRSLGRLNLWRAFKGQIFSADMVAHAKPAPDLLLLCAREFGVDPAECVMIDDSIHGIRSAKAAGMFPIGFVDANDPRPDRRGALMAQGAKLVAEGAENLLECIVKADAMLAPREGDTAPKALAES